MYIRDAERPTQEEVAEGLKVLEGILISDALRFSPQGCPSDPNLVKLLSWIKKEFNLE